MPHPLRFVADGDWQTLRSVVLAIARLLIDTGGISIGVRWGVANLSFTASTNSAVASVNHGLAVDPQVVLATSFGAPAFGKIPLCDVFAHDATTFSVTGELKTAHTGNIPVAWVVIG